MPTTIENCKISGTSLGIEDHGILTFFVHVEGEGWGCGFGGFAMDSYDKETDRRVGSAFGCEAIRGVLEALEKNNWEDLKGTPCRVETEGLGGGIVRLGHFYKNKWINLRELAKRHQP